MHLDDRVGNDSNVAPIPDAFTAKLIAHARSLRGKPVKMQAFIAGLGHQTLLTRPAVASALAPFMHMPKPEARTLKRARMAKVISECVAARDCVTREDLEAAGFSTSDITDLYREALRVSGVERMAA